MNELISDWQRFLAKEKGRAPNTILLYGRTLGTLQREVGEPETLSTPELRSWLQAKGGSAGTVGNRISALKSFYQFLVRSGARDDDPSAELVSPKHRTPPRKPVEDLQGILMRLNQTDENANLWSVTQRRVGETRDMAVFLAETGLRISEAVAGDWPVPCPPEIVVTKGRKRETVVVSKAARDAWDRLGGKWPVGARATQRRFEKADFHPHQLRHWHRLHKGNGSPSPGQGGTGIAAPDAGTGVLERVLDSYSEAERDVIRRFLKSLAAATE